MRWYISSLLHWFFLDRSFVWSFLFCSNKKMSQAWNCRPPLLPTAAVVKPNPSQAKPSQAKPSPWTPSCPFPSIPRRPQPGAQRGMGSDGAGVGPEGAECRQDHRRAPHLRPEPGRPRGDGALWHGRRQRCLAGAGPLGAVQGRAGKGCRGDPLGVQAQGHRSRSPTRPPISIRQGSTCVLNRQPRAAPYHTHHQNKTGSSFV